jgi:hypothetical protein
VAGIKELDESRLVLDELRRGERRFMNLLHRQFLSILRRRMMLQMTRRLHLTVRLVDEKECI